MRRRLLGYAKKIDWLGPLLARLVVGVTFVVTGRGKLADLDKVTAFFASLHIPLPHAQAILVGCTELVGGALLVVGLGARFASLPLAVTMIVAIATAKLPDADGIVDVLGFEETTYLAIFLWLAIAGAGRASIDHLLSKRLDRSADTRP